MPAPLPVDRENNFTRCLIHGRDNIDDQRPNQLLAHTHGDTRSIPGGVEVLGKLGEVRSSASWH